jgi:hypothetical protein
MDSMRKTNLQFIIDDLTAANASIKNLSSLMVATLYPGHGKPFPWEQFLKNYR